jgi:hypothetical protein
MTAAVAAKPTTMRDGALTPVAASWPDITAPIAPPVAEAVVSQVKATVLCSGGETASTSS